MTEQEKNKWDKLIQCYDYRRTNRIVPSAVPQMQLTNAGVTTEDIEDWASRGLVRILRSINDNLIKPLRK